MHGGTMTGRHAALPPLLDRICRHHFGEARVWIIGFITVAINVALKLFCQCKSVMYFFDAHITGPLVMWNASYEIAAQFHRPVHQLASIGYSKNTLLAKTASLQITKIASFF